MKEKSINLRHVPVSMRRALFAFLFFSAWATPNLCADQLEGKEVVLNEQSLQSKQIAVSGVVADQNGEPLIGVSVKVKGATVGTATDIDGKFSLNVPSTSAVLVFSYVGYATQDVTVGSKTTFDIVMHDDSKMLDQVVVTALGIKREKKALGYSVSSVSGDDMTKGGTPLNAASSLYGKAAGLQIGSTSAGPTGAMNIKIRNAMSLNESSSTRPLIIVDGIPIRDADGGSMGDDNRGVSGNLNRGGGLNDINPDDIASIEVLKGAKAAVLYGSEGANGVLLVTTKNGSGRKGLGIDFSANYSIIKKAYGPKFQNKYGTGNSPGTGKFDNLSKDGFWTQTVAGKTDPVESYWPGASGGFGPELDGREILSYDGTYTPYRAYKKNYDELYRTGGQTAVNLALSNSSEMGSFRLSYGFKDYKSIILNSDSRSHNFGFSGDLKVNDFIKLGVNSSYNHLKDQNSPYRIQDMSSYGVQRDLDVKKIKNTYVDSRGYSYFDTPTIKDNYPSAKPIAQYLWAQNQEFSDYSRDHFIQSLSLDVKFTDELSWTSLGGLDYVDTRNEAGTRFKRPMTEDSAQGYYGLVKENFTTYYAQSSLNFNKDLTNKWNLSVMAGGAVKRNKAEMQKTYIEREFATENFFSFTNTTNSSGPKAERTRGKDLLLSLFASAQIAYANQVYLEVQGRNDWSSILPPQNNNYFYPGVSLSWIMSETLKESLPDVVSFAKVRASWADVGRPGPRYYGNVNFKQGIYGGRVTLEVPDYLPPADFTGDNKGFPKPNLKPERKREFELGLEGAFFPQNRLSFDFSWFHSNTYNQITKMEVPSSSGVNEIRMNAGDIAQNGLELSINAKPIISKDLVWTVGVNFAQYSTTIKKLGKGITEQRLWGGVGANVMAPINGEFGEIWVRPYRVDEATGQRIVNGNGLWEIDNSKWKKVGKITPDVIGGFNTSLTYKGFTVAANINFQFGGNIISQTNMYLLGNGTGKESLKYRDEANGGIPYYRTKDGILKRLDSHSAAIPSDSYYPFIMHDGVVVPGVKSDGTPNDKVIAAQTYYQSTYWQSDSKLSEDMIYKSDYISLRQITLSYDLPKSFANKLKLQNARITLFGDNLAYFYKDIPNTTPESTQGTNSFTEYDMTPSARSFGMGVNLTF